MTLPKYHSEWHSSEFLECAKQKFSTELVDWFDYWP